MEDIKLFALSYVAVELTPGYWVARGYSHEYTLVIMSSITIIHYLCIITGTAIGFNLIRFLLWFVWVVIKFVFRPISHILVPFIDRFGAGSKFLDANQTLFKRIIIVCQTIKAKLEAKVNKIFNGGYRKFFFIGTLPLISGGLAIELGLKIKLKNRKEKWSDIILKVLALLAGGEFRVITFFMGWLILKLLATM